MSEIDIAGFARMQTQSRIAANQWRQWCSLCNLEPGEAVEVWDEVGYPVMITTRSAPPISFVLQMRSERRDVDILDFKDEIAKVLVFNAFMDVLQDERLSEGKGRGAVFRFYRARVTEGSAEHYDPLCVRDFALDLCKIFLVAKVLNQPNVVLSQVINLILKKKVSMEQLIKLGMKCLDDQPYATKVREALEAEDDWDQEEEREEVSEDSEEAYEDDGRREEETQEEEIEEGEEEEMEAEEVETAEEEEEENLEDGEEVEEEEFEEREEIDEEEEEEKRPKNSVEKFRAALVVLYETEARGNSAAAKKGEHLLRTRLEAIDVFDPLRAIIPNIEEAAAIVDRQQTVQNQSQRRLGGGASKGSRGGQGLGTLKRGPFVAPPSSSAAGGSATGGQTSSGGGGSAPASTGAAPVGPSEEAAAANVSSQAPAGEPSTSVPTETESVVPTEVESVVPTEMESASTEVESTEIEDVGTDTEAVLEVDPEDVLALIPIKAEEFSLRAKQIGQLLAAVERSDERTWNLFLEAGSEIETLPAYGLELTTKDSPANLAYRALRGVSQYQSLKNLLDRQYMTESARTFDAQVRAFVNAVERSRKELTTDDRQMAALEGILDAAGAALLRLETLKVAYTVAQDPEVEYTDKAVAQYCDKVLEAVLGEVDPEVLEAVREQAGEDARAILEMFGREHFVRSVVAQCRDYLAELREGGHTGSLDKAESAFGATPLEIVPAKPDDPAAELPAELQADEAFGPLLAAVCNHLTAAVWAALSPDHEPEEVIGKVQALVRQAMANHIVVEKPEKRRHADNSRFPLSVVSLGQLSGDAQFKDMYVRVGVDGRLFYAEGFEDETYVDLFELREFKSIRVQSKGIDSDEGGPLKTGEKYLHTIGRTKQVFGATPAAVLASCIKEEDGAPKIFPVFRRTARP